MKFLVGGGNQTDRTSVNLVVDGKIVETAVGNQTETLNEVVWDLKAYQGKKAIVKVIDLDVYPWGHILADQFVLTDNKNENLYSLSSTATLLADFEGVNWGDWQVIDSSEEESNFWRMRRIQRLCTDLGIRNVSRTCMTLLVIGM